MKSIYLTIALMCLLIFPSEAQKSHDTPSKEDTAEWLKQMLNNRKIQSDYSVDVYKAIDLNFSNVDILNIGISTMVKSEKGFLKTTFKDFYTVDFKFLDPQNLKISENEIIISTTNGEKQVQLKKYIYEDKSIETIYPNNTNQIVIPINGREIFSWLLNSGEPIETIRVKNAFSNLIIKNGGLPSTILWESDEEKSKNNTERIKKLF